MSSARVELLERGTRPELHGVPDVVAASWKRCVSHGVEPDSLHSGYSPEFDVASRLAHSAEPVVEQLAAQIMDVPACVALTDDKARILRRIDGDPWIARLLDRVYFAQGFGYAEDSVGTNGVGTVFESGRSVQIVGEEHFVSSLHAFACAGAPVRDPFTGRIEGVLDISCLSDHSTPIFHSLVRAAAAQIEHNLLLDRDAEQQALFDRYSRTESRTRKAVLAVGRRTVLSNRAMKSLVAPQDHAALEEHLRFTMDRHDHVDDRIDLPSGIRVRMRGERVLAGSSVAGMVARIVLLREVDADPVPSRTIAPPDRPGPASGGRETASPTMRAAERTVAAAFGGRAPVLVLGEPGTGRTRLLRDRFRALHPGAEVVVLDRTEVELSPAAAAARIRDGSTTGPRLCVLRDLDALPAEVARALAGELQAGCGAAALAATAADGLRAAVAGDGLLRIFRHSVTVPPLRHRTGDLPDLVHDVLAELAPRREVRVSAEALRMLERYRWPGNIAQLADVLRSALRRRPVGDIEVDDLPTTCQSTPRSSLRRVDEIERDAIIAALREHEGNRKAAASALGVARSTLYRKIHLYGITV
nr:helix-turn-helix domain-containing protein [Pseudonocardia sp. C8]